MSIQNQEFLYAKQVNAESSAILSQRAQSSQTAQSLGVLRDDDLLSQTKLVAAQERRLTAQLLAHLREIERRRLFAGLGYSSLFAYVTEELGYCAASAQARITSMRLLTQLPEIESKVVSGELTLTNLAQAQRFFQQEQKIQNKTLSISAKKEVIEKLEVLSTREAVKELMSLSSEPEALARPDQIRSFTAQLSEVRFTADQKLLDQLDELRGLLAHRSADMSLGELISQISIIALERLREQRSGGRARAPKGETTSGANTRVPKRAKSSEASKNLKSSNVSNVSETSLETPQKASQESSIETVMAEAPGAAVASGAVQRAVITPPVITPTVGAPPMMIPQTYSPAAPLAAEALESEILAIQKRFNVPATLEHPTVPVMPEGPHVSPPPSRSRHIPACIRRSIFKRDGFACSYQNAISGRRCGSRYALELDHRTPFAKGGLHNAENLTARCRAHNQWAALQTFGPKKMAQYGK